MTNDFTIMINKYLAMKIFHRAKKNKKQNKPEKHPPPPKSS